MHRRSLIIGAFAWVCGAFGADVTACGDKFLRPGRNVRRRRFAALHRSSILFYRPAGSTAKGISDFETLLKGAGHTPTILQRGASVAQALAAAKYDLLIADYADAGSIAKAVGSVPGGPTVLPLVLSKGVEREARRDFVCFIRPYAMTPYDALAEIDRAMELRLKNTTLGSS